MRACRKTNKETNKLTKSGHTEQTARKKIIMNILGSNLNWRDWLKEQYVAIPFDTQMKKKMCVWVGTGGVGVWEIFLIHVGNCGVQFQLVWVCHYVTHHITSPLITPPAPSQPPPPTPPSNINLTHSLMTNIWDLHIYNATDSMIKKRGGGHAIHGKIDGKNEKEQLVEEVLSHYMIALCNWL